MNDFQQTRAQSRLKRYKEWEDTRNEFIGNSNSTNMASNSLPVLYISESCIKVKINLNFIFTRLCGASKDLHKTCWGTTKKCENYNLINFLSSSGIRTRRINFIVLQYLTLIWSIAYYPNILVPFSSLSIRTL